MEAKITQTNGKTYTKMKNTISCTLWEQLFTNHNHGGAMPQKCIHLKHLFFVMKMLNAMSHIGSTWAQIGPGN